MQTKTTTTKTSKTQAFSIPTIEELFKVGAHFGHKKEKSDARSREFVFLTRDRVMIIDLEKTRSGLEKALAFAKEIAQTSGTFLFVGTKPHLKEIVKNAATVAGQPFIINRWLGGMLTNFDSVKQNVARMKKTEEKLINEELKLTKREKQKLSTKITKFNLSFEGVKELTKLPDALVVIDGKREATAIAEAVACEIPVIGLIDTNANPQTIDYPIPANDDSAKAVELLLGLLAGTIKANYKAKVEIPAEKPKAESSAEALEQAVPAKEVKAEAK